MFVSTKKFIILSLTAVVLVFGPANAYFQTQTDADTSIFNFAKALYENEEGMPYTTVSATVEIKVEAISSVVVTPDEVTPTEVVVPNETITREFGVCNTSNAVDSYTVTNLTVSNPAEISGIYLDVDEDGIITANDIEITINEVLTNLLDPGKCISILVEIDTNDIAPKEELKIVLTVRSNNEDAVNGQAEDSGTIVSSGGKAANFTDPEDPTLIPSKLVQNLPSYVSSKNEPLEYEISFQNAGDVDARDVVITDEFPAELIYIANTMKVDGRTLTDIADSDEGEIVDGNVIIKLVSNVKPGQVVRLTFKAMVVGGSIPAQGIINVAKVGAGNAQTIDTTNAVVVIDPFGTVYAARGGASSPIPGALVEILTDANGSPITIPAGVGFEPNFDNTNPYLTNSEGRFSFALRPDQLGTLTTPETYVVRVTAENFRSRLIQITLSPNGNGLFQMMVVALDGMPVAIADGFELTENEVEITSIADVAFNIPMFEEAVIEVTKTVDRIQAGLGDVINYRVEVGNTSVAPLFDVIVKDTLPNSFNYVEGTARVIRGSDSLPIEAVITGHVMQFNVGDLASGERISIQYRVRIGVNAQKGDNYNSAVVSGGFESGEVVSSFTTRALVKVGRGLFSMRQFMIGRVFVDENSNNRFDKGDKGVAGARLYLANGNSVTTDSQGLYSIPAISSGSQVIALDPVTIPAGYVLTDQGRRSGKDWTRLIRTPLGGGAMLRQNFALAEGFAKPETAKSIVKTSLNKLPAANARDKSKPVDSKTEDRVFEKVLPGDILIHDLSNGSVIASPAVNLEVSVATDWTAQIELNGRKIGDNNIGTTRRDAGKKIVTYTFVGLGLKPGPNTLRATSIGPGQVPGKTVEIEIFGRGAARRLKIVAERNELQASGRDSTTLIIEAYDEWEHAAQDGSVMVETSSGRLLRPEESIKENDKAKAKESVMRSDLLGSSGNTSTKVNATSSQQKINLVNGVGIVKLISANQKGTAKITVSQGQAEASTDILFTSEIRPSFLSGLAEVTIGKNAPAMVNRDVDENVRTHIQFFYKGSLFGKKNMLTLAYDSQEPLNRISGKDGLFQLNPLDNVYPMFGDSSTRFQETASNSKVYARFDSGRSYGMFGDFNAGLDKSRLMGYARRLTGAKVHLENSKGDFVTVSGAKPDTSFARQVIPGGSLGIVQLSFGDILVGSEVLAIETRDRRNPEIILTREILSRSVDYNLDTSTGTIFFLRQIPTFDRELNLIQVVATYEYRAQGLESSVYTARASRNFDKLGLRLGFSYIYQKQTESSPFQLGGIDASLKLPNHGKLEFEWARSNGALNTGFGFGGNRPSGSGEYNGDAFFVSVDQPLPFNQSRLKFDGFSASKDFYNPFGATVTPGTTRGSLTVETKPLKNGTLKVNLIGERNKTENVDNSRVTLGADWSQVINEKVRFNFGYSLRKFSDSKSDRNVFSNLITVGADFKPTNKLDFSIKREQNLGSEDPTFPNQTIIGANYQFSQNAKLFFTQRFASNTITPISDTANTGFAASNARNETAIGIETKFGKYTSMSGRYQLENGINGTDSFSIIGLNNRLPIRKDLSLEIGYERAFHLAGNGQSYNNFTLGANWLPDENFRTSFRYELRDRQGLNQLFSIGAAGNIKPGWTTMGRFQYGHIDFNGRENRVRNGELALAIRPHDTDKYGLLLSYKHRNSFISGNNDEAQSPTQFSSDVFSADGFHQTTSRLELYGRFALKFSADGNSNLPYASNLTYLTQGRAQYRISRWLDLAGEGRYLYQPSSGSQNKWLAAEMGYWVTPELRIGGGYNFSRSKEVIGFNNNEVFNRGGFYFTITTKLSRLFNLFGTKKKGLEHYENDNRKLPADVSRNNKK